jgi:hypothetical protein
VETRLNRSRPRSRELFQRYPIFSALTQESRLVLLLLTFQTCNFCGLVVLAEAHLVPLYITVFGLPDRKTVDREEGFLRKKLFHVKTGEAGSLPTF